MTHAYSHVPVAQKSSVQQPAPNAHDFCADCLNFAPLLAAAGAPAATAFAAPPAGASVSPPAADDLLEHKTTLAFRSRAPPVDR